MGTGDCQGMEQTGVAAAMNCGHGVRVNKKYFTAVSAFAQIQIPR